MLLFVNNFTLTLILTVILLIKSSHLLLTGGIIYTIHYKYWDFIKHFQKKGNLFSQAAKPFWIEILYNKSVPVDCQTRQAIYHPHSASQFAQWKFLSWTLILRSINIFFNKARYFVTCLLHLSWCYKHYNHFLPVLPLGIWELSCYRHSDWSQWPWN